MESKNIMVISIVAVAAILLIIFLIRRNRKDIDVLNPDADRDYRRST